MLYRGWQIDYKSNNPVTSQWVAARFGVTINGGTKEAVQRMIDLKIYHANAPSNTVFYLASY